MPHRMVYMSIVFSVLALGLACLCLWKLCSRQTYESGPTNHVPPVPVDKPDVPTMTCSPHKPTTPQVSASSDKDDVPPTIPKGNLT